MHPRNPQKRKAGHIRNINYACVVDAGHEEGIAVLAVDWIDLRRETSQLLLSCKCLSSLASTVRESTASSKIVLRTVYIIMKVLLQLHRVQNTF